jgi:hypothetical protein
MTTLPILALAAALAAAACAADVCDPSKLAGAYGFQLSGNTTISGDSKPVVSVGRLVFAAPDPTSGQGALSGYSSVNFAGYFLGNPVIGTYEAHTDCTISWSLQDDSGAFQHFGGKLTPDSSAAEFHQSDPGGAEEGVMQKVSPRCSTAGLTQLYSFGISGSTTPMNPGDVSRQVSTEGSVEPDSAGNLKITIPKAAETTGTITVDSDCFAAITMTLPSGDSISLRGILVNGGKQILAMETDAGATVTAKFNAKAAGQQ